MAKGRVYRPFSKAGAVAPNFLNVHYITQALSDATTASEAVQILLDIFSEPIFDSIDVAQLLAMVIDKSIQDEVSNSQQIIIAASKVIADSSSVADSPTKSIAKAISDVADVEDLLGVPDGITYQFIKSKVENLTATQILAYALSKPFSDSVSKSDTPLLLTSKVFADSASLSELVDILLDLGVNPTENLSVAQALIYVMAKALTESLNASENLAYSLSKPVSESLSSTDVPRKLISKTFADSVSTSDLLIAGSLFEPQVDGDSSSTTDAHVLTFSKVANDTLTPLDVLTRVVTFEREFGDSADAFENLALLFSAPKDDSATTSDLILFDKGKAPVDSVTASITNLVKTINMVASDVADVEDLLGVPDGITYLFNQSKSENVATGDVLTRIHTASRTFIDSGDTLDVLTYDITKSFTESLVKSDSPILNIGKTIADTANGAENLVKQISKPFSDSSINIDSASLSINIAKADTVSEADAGTLARQNYFEEDYIEITADPYDAVEFIAFT